MQNLFKHQGAKYITAGWSLFVAENLILSENRTAIIDKFGLSNYRSVYGIFSTISMSSVLFGFFKYGKGLQLTQKPIAIPRIIGGLFLQVLGFNFYFQQLPPLYQKPNEEVLNNYTEEEYLEKVTKEHEQKKLLEEQGVIDEAEFYEKYPEGVLKITRHPGLYALGFTGLGSALMSNHSNRILFGLLPFISVFLLSQHQDSRFRRGMGGVLTPEMQSRSSNFPFVSFIDGTHSFKQYMNKDFNYVNFYIANTAVLLLNLRRSRFH